jgi:hypothetical protein
MDISFLNRIRKSYAIQNIVFLGKAAFSRKLRGLDLIVCRDIFTHTPLTQILDTLEEIKASGAKYILATTFLNRKNTGYTCLFSTPFSFPQPLELISHQCMTSFPNYVDKSIGLWRVADLPTYIPRHIIQCWHSKELPELLQKNGELIRRAHPGFRHTVFSFDECETFIADNFDPKVLHAYQNLVPPAYKCDLWRCCYMYIHGGIYLDIAVELNNFTFIELIDREHFTTEVPGLFPYGWDKYKGVSNSLMILHPGNTRMKQMIDAIVDNVEKQFYGRGVYDITGAVLLGSFFTLEEKKKLLLQREAGENYNRWTLDGEIVLQRMADYDKGLPGRPPGQQTYIKHWWDKTVFKSTT